jgi:hypothetical protein
MNSSEYAIDGFGAKGIAIHNGSGDPAKGPDPARSGRDFAAERAQTSAVPSY